MRAAAGVTVLAAWVACVVLAVTRYAPGHAGAPGSLAGQRADRAWAWAFAGGAGALTVPVFAAVTWPLARRLRRRGRPVGLTRRNWLLVGAAGVAFAGLCGYGAARSLAPPAAARSLAEIRVSGYQKTGELDGSSSTGTSSAGTYIGPPAALAQLPRIVSGPGVRITLFREPSTAVEFSGTDTIGYGTAPRGCALDLNTFYRDAAPSAWWGITPAQLREVRAGRRAILLIWAVC